jgi:TBC1 domain family member 6
LQTVARIFDALLLEGSKILHRVALAMFKLAAPRLLAAQDTVEASDALQATARHIVNHDMLMQLATSRKIGRLRRKDIEKLRAEARTELQPPPQPRKSAAANGKQVSHQ